MNAIVPSSAVALVPHDMDQAIRLAKAMSSARMVPKHLQDDVGTCLMVIEQAMRWRMSPFAVAQCTSAIGGKLMFEGKLVAAAVETSGAIEGGFDYKFEGDGDDRRVTVSATRTGERNPRQITIRLCDVRTSNEWWKRQPDQQLVYSGTRNWARRWTPAVILGVYAPEEFDRQSGKVVADDFTGPTIESKPEPEPPPEPKRMTLRAWLDEFEARCAAAQTEAEANAILREERVMRLDDPDLKINPSVLQRALNVRKAMIDRIWPQPPGDDDEEAPAIKGEEYVNAG